jgi:endonuclease/exonuclease/phosphatase family metal-dependent hydrolase
LRGWVSVDVTPQTRGKTFRFVNTHLDPYFPLVRDIQAQEFVDGPLAATLKLIAVGDFDSPRPGRTAAPTRSSPTAPTASCVTPG